MIEGIRFEMLACAPWYKHIAHVDTNFVLAWYNRVQTLHTPLVGTTPACATAMTDHRAS